MSGIQEALRRMELQPTLLARSLLAVPIDAAKECRRLTDLARDFAERAGQPRIPRLLPDPKDVWRQWVAQQFDPQFLDARRIKALCADPETATQPEFVGALHQHAEDLKRTICLAALISSYFARWGSIPHQDRMELLISDALTKYAGRNPIVKQYREHARLLFRPSAAQDLASVALGRRDPPKECLKQFHVGLATNLATSTIVSAAQRFPPRPAAAGTAVELFGGLKYAIDHLFVPELPTTDLLAAVSGVICSDWIEKHPNCRAMLREFVLHHKDLGDPRIKQANWVGMTPTAKARFLKWIANESIVFFFNYVLPDNSTNERRKRFWLEYAGAITDFQVALSHRDQSRLIASAVRKDVPGFASVDHWTTSAFIMQFGDLVVVEFSETGNAAHLFAARSFQSRAGGLRNSRFSFAKLKHEADAHRILHVADWEFNARQKLAESGVRP